MRSVLITLLVASITFTLTACGRTSSPEGRMSIKLEQLQKEMRDSLKKQNEAILDTLSRIRQDLNRLERKVK